MGANITVESIGISPAESIMEALWLYSSQTSSLIGRMPKAKVISTAEAHANYAKRHICKRGNGGGVYFTEQILFAQRKKREQYANRAYI